MIINASLSIPMGTLSNRKKIALLCPALTAIIEKKANLIMQGLEKEPSISSAIAAKPLLVEVLAKSIRDGKITGPDAVDSALREIRIAQAGSDIANILLAEGARPSIRSRQSNDVKRRLECILEEAKAHHSASAFASDSVFLAYLTHMVRVVKNAPSLTDRLAEPEFRAALLNHISSEFELLRATGVPKTTIKSYAHMNPVFYFNDVYLEAVKAFGSDESTAGLVKTAASLVWNKKYSSISMAKEAYVSIYDKKMKAHVKHLRYRAGDLPTPVLDGLRLEVCLAKLKPTIERIGRMYAFSIGSKDATQEVYMVAILLLQNGTRDANELIDAMFCHVEKIAENEKKSPLYFHLPLYGWYLSPSRLAD